jgi:diadenosine tetraphosphate (Ap4A) HIT family hydrolase
MSVFLTIDPSEWVDSNDLAFAIRDKFPVSPGHTLVIPKRVIPTWWEATREEQLALLELVDSVKVMLDHEYAPDGYNVGFNAGVAAGQTVDHLHIHVIPRYAGDMADPRGGVRHVIPSKGNYLRPPAPVSEEAFELFDGQERLLSLELNRRLRAPEFDRIDFEVSFVMRSGLNVLFSAHSISPGEHT